MDATGEAEKTWSAQLRHDLRTPLNAIMGYCAIMMEDAEDLRRLDLVEQLAEIRNTGRRLLGLIGEVLPRERDGELKDGDDRDRMEIIGRLTPCLDDVAARTDRLQQVSLSLESDVFQRDIDNVQAATVKFRTVLKSASLEDREIKAYLEETSKE